jgi:manganese transport protein
VQRIALARPRYPAIGLRALGRKIIPLLGPAFVASIAYVDPGNFATNIQGGAEYGYMLLWVILAANVMAMFVQHLSAKLGIATGHNLPEVCRQRFRRWVNGGLWVQAEFIAIATDLAEFMGAAIALNLLFGIPLFAAGIATGIVSFGVLGLEAAGRRRFERMMMFFLGLITVGFLFDALGVGFEAGATVKGFIPTFDGSGSVLLATGMLGATVMPHAIYLHSALTQDRAAPQCENRRTALVVNRVDILTAMGVAGIVNMLMLVVAASLFHRHGLDVRTLHEAYGGFKHLAGGLAALAFALALLASGLSSASVGTFAGQVVMQGFVARTIPIVLRRLMTMLPSLVILAVGLNATEALVVSQVVLSFGIPFALIPLVRLTSDPDVMGDLVNGPSTTALAWTITALIVGLNAFLIAQVFQG